MIGYTNSKMIQWWGILFNMSYSSLAPDSRISSWYLVPTFSVMVQKRSKSDPWSKLHIALTQKEAIKVYSIWFPFSIFLLSNYVNQKSKSSPSTCSICSIYWECNLFSQMCIGVFNVKRKVVDILKCLLQCFHLFNCCSYWLLMLHKIQFIHTFSYESCSFVVLMLYHCSLFTLGGVWFLMQFLPWLLQSGCSIHWVCCWFWIPLNWKSRCKKSVLGWLSVCVCVWTVSLKIVRFHGKLLLSFQGFTDLWL